MRGTALKDEEALYYEKLDGLKVRCRLCPHLLRDRGRRRGEMRRAREPGRHALRAVVRAHRHGASRSDREEAALSFHAGERDPLDRAERLHARAATTARTGTSRRSSRRRSTSRPRSSPELASREGSIGVAFTYTEPLLWFEYLKDVAAAPAREGAEIGARHERIPERGAGAGDRAPRRRLQRRSQGDPGRILQGASAAGASSR